MNYSLYPLHNFYNNKSFNLFFTGLKKVLCIGFKFTGFLLTTDFSKFYSNM